MMRQIFMRCVRFSMLALMITPLSYFRTANSGEALTLHAELLSDKRADWHSPAVTAITFSNNSDRVVIGFENGTVAACAFNSEDLPVLFNCSGHVNALSVTEDGLLWVAVEQAGLEKWNLDSGKRVEMVRLPFEDGTRFVTSNTGRNRIFAASTYSWAGVWNYIDHTVESRLEPSDRNFNTAVVSVAVSERADLAIMGLLDNTCEIYRLRSGIMIRRLGRHAAPGFSSKVVALTDDGSTLAIADTDGLRFIRTKDWHETGCVGVRDVLKTVPTAMRFSPNGRFLAVVSSHGLRLWNVKEQSLSKEFGDEATVVAFSPDNKFIGTARRLNNPITIWSVK